MPDSSPHPPPPPIRTRSVRRNVARVEEDSPAPLRRPQLAFSGESPDVRWVEIHLGRRVVHENERAVVKVNQS